MREAAHEIRTEVGHLTQDVARLRERVLNLQKHFGQANEDVAQILISADKVAKRGGRIEIARIRDDEPKAAWRSRAGQPKATAAE
jgi:DNA recombination protein RmuC